MHREDFDTDEEWEEAILHDVFDPNESDLEYFLRRIKELSSNGEDLDKNELDKDENR